MKVILLSILAAISIPLLALATNDNGKHAVIVNLENSISGSQSHLANEVRLLFLRQKHRWNNGIHAIPISSKQDSESYRHFASQVLHMSKEELRNHWRSIKLSKGDNPPTQVSSERMIARLVTRDAGSFGIVSKATAEKMKDKVKVLFVF